LWELKLVTPKPYNNAATIIVEIERNIKNIVRKPQIEKVRILQTIVAEHLPVNRVKTADKHQKAVLDFIRS